MCDGNGDCLYDEDEDKITCANHECKPNEKRCPGHTYACIDETKVKTNTGKSPRANFYTICGQKILLKKFFSSSVSNRAVKIHLNDLKTP